MKIGIFTSLFNDLSLEETLKYAAGIGIEAVELYCGQLVKSNHCNPEELLSDNSKLNDLKELLKKYNFSISMLNCSGNPVHPSKEIAFRHHTAFENAVLLAEKLGVDKVCTFSGCPGGGPRDETPNWITCPWPEEHLEILDYQWNDILVPYWTKAVAFARDHGVNKIALEMHPGFCVYNPESLLRLRKQVGVEIGSNFDPSHLFWQGIEPVEAIMALEGAIYHVHMKDTKINKNVVSKYGVLDTKHYSNIKDRAWLFRTVGYGHDYSTWKDIISTLRMTGYDGVLSIEHEDSLMSKEEGVEKAVKLLQEVIIREMPEGMWWA